MPELCISILIPVDALASGRYWLSVESSVYGFGGYGQIVRAEDGTLSVEWQSVTPPLKSLPYKHSAEVITDEKH